MFKSLMSSINGHGHQKASANEVTKNTEDIVSKSTNSKVDCANHNTNGNSANLGKKSKRKFTSMMGKISSGISSGKSKQQQQQQANRNIEDNGEESDQFQSLDNQMEIDLNSSTSTLKMDDVEYERGDKDAFILPEEQCDIPTFLHTKNCDPHLIEETRRLLKERYAKNPDNFYDADYQRMLADDWTVSRFLLRRRLDPKRTAKLMEECGGFRKKYKMSEVKLWEFPIEFHKAGGLFRYAPDRVGNLTVYMRVKMYRRVPEISDVFKAWILCVLEESDVANNGRGTAVIFDLTGCSLQNVDLGFLSWLLSSFRNYCPKGVSYIIVYNLPWILNATCKLAMSWMSASNRRSLRFVHGDEIENFIPKENLPDYCGGTCKLNYRAIPEGSKPAIEVCDRLDMTREQALKIKELFKEYLNDDDDENETEVCDSDGKTNEKHSTQNYNSTQIDHLDGNLKFEDALGGTQTNGFMSRASKFLA